MNNAAAAAPAKQKTNWLPLIIALAALLVIGLVIGLIVAKSNTLSGDDKVAYELLMDVVDKFKDPSSVRIVSGRVGVDKDCLFCGISAVNGFGARNTRYYFIMGGQIVTEDDPNYLYTETTKLNYDKINKALQKSVGSKY